MANRLAGKVAIVTGGTMGIGRAIAEQFVAEGAKVVITARKADLGEKVAQEIGQPEQIQFLQQDVADEERWQVIFDETERRFGKVTTLVNNAGMALAKDIEHTTTEEWHRVMAVNLDSVFFGTRLGIQRMKNDDNAASIINMSSIEGFVGDPILAAYNASKGGVRMMSKSAALYTALNDLGVRVNTVHPGYIRTPMVADTPMETAMAARTKTPLGHLGDPNDIAYMCVFLASDESKFATGSEYVVDGGYTAQ
ncbi:NADP-dependent (R)-specific alcohol dehydrogenase [Pediococcus pentosaceus]|uniref:glucose 1-dehydrogenase n=1 Tax=Pediococcus pentosaceus TaxID=1255 RepID=UPI00398213B7